MLVQKIKGKSLSPGNMLHGVWPDLLLEQVILLIYRLYPSDLLLVVIGCPVGTHPLRSHYYCLLLDVQFLYSRWIQYFIYNMYTEVYTTEIAHDNVCISPPLGDQILCDL